MFKLKSSAEINLNTQLSTALLFKAAEHNVMLESEEETNNNQRKPIA